MNRAALKEQAADLPQTGITVAMWCALLDLRLHAGDSRRDAHAYQFILRADAGRYVRRGGRS